MAEGPSQCRLQAGSVMLRAAACVFTVAREMEPLIPYLPTKRRRGLAGQSEEHPPNLLCEAWEAGTAPGRMSVRSGDLGGRRCTHHWLSCSRRLHTRQGNPPSSAQANTITQFSTSVARSSFPVSASRPSSKLVPFPSLPFPSLRTMPPTRRSLSLPTIPHPRPSSKHAAAERGLGTRGRCR